MRINDKWWLSQDARYFLAIVEAKSLSVAAERTGVNQPALSKALARLEAQAGVPLLVRHRTGVGTTRAGEELLLELRSSSGKAPGAAGIGRLVIGCHEALANTYMPRVLPALARAMPDTQVELLYAPSVEVSRMLNAGSIDAGVVVNPLKNANFTFLTLEREQGGVFSHGTGGPHDLLLVHPDMLMLENLLRRRAYGKILKVPSYETIALTLKQERSWAGLLPANTANRHGLTMVGAKLFEVTVNLIVYKDKLPKEAKNRLFGAFRESAR